MKIMEWPEQDRPREKLLKNGAEHLSDAELLAILLRTGTKDENALSLALRILVHFQSLKGLFSATHNQFCSLRGVGSATFVQLQAAKELSGRLLVDRSDALHHFTSSADTKAFLINKLVAESKEVFALLMLDSQHRLIRYKNLFTGTINEAAVYPREIVKDVLEQNASAVILAHNHPSGKADPSAADIAITQRIQAALATIDVKVLDHIIVGQGYCTSLAERGDMLF
ncbi:MAG: DNA repair protein RadC [Aestuariibacter sp.]